MRLLTVLLLSPQITPLLEAQELDSITHLPLRGVATASLDRKGALLLADEAGTVIRVMPDGSRDPIYSPERNNRVSLIEAWTTLDILLFYEAPQVVTVLNRFLAPIASYDLSAHAGFARLATYSGESNLWLLDDSDFSLKLFDTSRRSVIIHNPLNFVLDPKRYDLTFMREYQNLLFISDREAGILVFDNLGNYLRTLAEASVSFFGFLDNSIYFVEDETLRLIDIYSGQVNQLEVPRGKFHLLSRDHLYLVTAAGVTIYRY